MYFANFYVYNTLHGATLANCSHFQYVSRLRLRVFWISVKICIDVTLYDELLFTSIIEKILSSLDTKDKFDRCHVIHSRITIVPLTNSWQGTLHVRYTA